MVDGGTSVAVFSGSPSHIFSWPRLGKSSYNSRRYLLTPNDTAESRQSVSLTMEGVI